MSEAPRYDPPLIDQLAEALGAAGFAAARIEEATTGGGSGLAALPVLARRLSADHPLAPLIALFVHGVPVLADRLDSALAPLGVAGAERLGLVGCDGSHATAHVRLAPFGPLLLASDRLAEPFRDFVMGGSGSTRTLANLTIRRPVGSALDLGTGSGVQALLAAKHADQVTATDVSPRALAFARFNARLNHVDNLELVEGPWLEPVAGRRFDLVLSNPPFVVSPDADLLFRDGPDPGDGVSRHLVEAVPDHLNAGGVAQLLASWVHGAAAGTWSDPVRRWVPPGCDGWLLRVWSQDPASYAVQWNNHLAGDPAGQAAAVQRWLDWYADAGVKAIGYGLVLLRRHDGATWFRADDIPEVPAEPAGEQLAAALAAHDELGSLGTPDALLDRRPVTNPRHRLEQVLHPVDGGYAVQAARVRLREPLGFSADVDAYAATLLTLLDGSRTLRDAAVEAGQVLPDPPTDLASRAAMLVTTMVAMGLVRLDS